MDRQGNEKPLDDTQHRYASPRLSSDGTRVALEIRDEQPDIAIWDIGRRILTPVTSDAALDWLPVWLPDGRRLVWGSNRGGGLSNIYSRASDGTGTVERLTESANSQRPSSVTRDGWLLLAEAAPARTGADQAGADIGVLPLDGDRRVTSLVNQPGAQINPEISPDGQWLAYESLESGRSEIFVRPFRAVDQGRHHVSTNGGREPMWARSGREIFYLAPDGTLMGVPVDTGSGGATFAAGTPAALIAGGSYYTQTAFHGGRTYDVSLDGARFLRIKVDPNIPVTSRAPRHVVVVLNWFEELKRLAPTR